MHALPSKSLRSCLGRFATGVAVVTFAGPEGPRGITVNSFTSVSTEPPLVLVSVARAARSHDVLSGRPFCVNVLAAEQELLARRFSGAADLTAVDQPAVDWLEGCRVPRLAGTLAVLECDPWREYEGGDHTLFVGEVTDYDYRDGAALAFHTSRFTAIVENLPGIEGLL